VASKSTAHTVDVWDSTHRQNTVYIDYGKNALASTLSKNYANNYKKMQILQLNIFV